MELKPGQRWRYRSWRGCDVIIELDDRRFTGACIQIFNDGGQTHIKVGMDFSLYGLVPRLKSEYWTWEYLEGQDTPEK